MIKGQNILCFGSENWMYPGFQQTIMRKLSTKNRVIYVNSIGTRRFTIKGSQIKFYIKRIKSFISTNKNSGYAAGVYSPRIIPIVYNNMISRINKQLIKIQFKNILSRHRFKSYILWIGTPTASFILDCFSPELIVYHPVDRYSEFPFVNQSKIRIFESIIAKRADVILCTSDAIRNDLIDYNKNAYTVCHAVEFNHFHIAGLSKYVPEDIKTIPKPIIGYFGGLSDRVNFRLIKKLSLRYSYASIVLIGNKLTNTDELERLKNVYILGHKKYKILPFYLKEFSVCLIPYHVNELMKGVDPIKLREYLCLGKPVVSVDLPEVRKLEDIVYIASGEDDFVLKVDHALSENLRDKVKDRVMIAKSSDWDNKMIEISEILLPRLKKPVKH